MTIEPFQVKKLPLPSRSLVEQMLRFLVVGILNTAFGYGCFAVLLHLGLRYPIALLFATIAGVLFNFRTIGRLVFRDSDNTRLIRFVLVYAVVYIVNLGLVDLFVQLGCGPYVAGAFALVPVAAIAFILNRSFVFRNV